MDDSDLNKRHFRMELEASFISWNEEKTKALRDWVVASLKLRNLAIPVGELIKILLLNFGTGQDPAKDIEQ